MHKSKFTQSLIKSRKALALLELVVAVAIIAMFLAIMMPAMNKARRKALSIKCMDNHRKIVIAVSAFASDNKGKFPESVATIGRIEEHWNWQEPTMLIASRPRSPELHRSMSEYLRSYIQDTAVLLCPTAPQKNIFLQQAWDAGDDWDNPDTLPSADPLIGSYCFYWNYIGYLPQSRSQFKGPKDLESNSPQSRLLTSDYFGFGHWRNKLVYSDYKAYGSCERFAAASVTPGTEVSSPFWSSNNPNLNLDTFSIDLHAAYTDGHVESYSPKDTVIMEVSKTPDGTVPYPDQLGPGQFYLPKNALY